MKVLETLFKMRMNKTVPDIDLRVTPSLNCVMTKSVRFSQYTCSSNRYHLMGAPPPPPPTHTHPYTTILLRINLLMHKNVQHNIARNHVSLTIIW